MIGARSRRRRTAKREPSLGTGEHDVVSFRDNALELHALAPAFPCGFFEGGNEAVLAVRHAGIVLDVGSTSLSLDGLARSTQVEHEIVKRDHVSRLSRSTSAIIPLLK